MLYCIDEAGFYVGDHPRKGRAKRGQRLAIGTGKSLRKTKFTLVMAIGVNGIAAQCLLCLELLQFHFFIILYVRADIVINPYKTTICQGRPSCTIHRLSIRHRTCGNLKTACMYRILYTQSQDGMEYRLLSCMIRRCQSCADGPRATLETTIIEF